MQYDDLSTKYLEAIKEFIPALAEAAGVALQGEVAFESEEPTPIEEDYALPLEFPVLKVTFGSTAEGSYEHEIYMQQSLAGNVFGWMLGEDPPEELTEEHFDAVKEIIGQVMGQLQATFDGEPLAFKAGDVNIANIESADEMALPSDALIATYHFTFKGGEDKYPLVYAFYSEMIPDADADADAPADADADEPTDADAPADADVPADAEGLSEDLIGDDSVTEDVAEGISADLPDVDDLLSDDDSPGAGMDDLFADDSDGPQDIVEASPAGFEDFGDSAAVETGGRKIDMLLDVELDITVELGRKIMIVEEILRLGKGSVIELNKLAGEPVDILVNGKKLAEGEVVVVEDHFGVRLTHLLDPQDRIKSLGR